MRGGGGASTGTLPASTEFKATTASGRKVRSDSREALEASAGRCGWRRRGSAPDVCCRRSAVTTSGEAGVGIAGPGRGRLDAVIAGGLVFIGGGRRVRPDLLQVRGLVRRREDLTPARVHPGSERDLVRG